MSTTLNKMNDLTQIEMPYSQDSTHLFTKLQDLPWAVYLDSCHPYCRQGRYDIITACPFLTVITQGASTFVKSDIKQQVSNDEPIQIIKRILENYPACASHFPFTGGAIGYFAYDLAYRLVDIPKFKHIPNKNRMSLPELALGIYDWAIIVDHDLRCAHLVSANRCKQTKHLLPNVQKRLEQKIITSCNHFKLVTPWQSNITKSQYAKAFEKIKTHLRQGDCYQINYTQCFNAQYQGPTWCAYTSIRQVNPAPYAAYINFDQATIMSFSPEQFIQVTENKAITAPIKGTKPRGSNSSEDKKFADDLLTSRKDRAENLMIVDLLRNDFAKVCRPGTVHVPHLLRLESFSNVHHLISTVIGELESQYHSLDLLRCCFPGGSITGAPKYKAMEIINALEVQSRSVYTGAIGYIDFNDNLNTNIAIRTLICNKDDKQIYCCAGGGIVADSELDDEYQETMIKIYRMLEHLQQINKKHALQALS